METRSEFMPMLTDSLEMFVFLGVELSVLFLLISAAVSLLQQYIPDSKIQALLSASNGRGYILAAFLGAVTPFCSCSTIPMLRGLLRAKAGFGPTLTFLFTSPLLNPIILGIFVMTFGWYVTAIYTFVAFVVSIIAGIILDKMGFEKHVIPENAQTVASCCATAPKQEASCCDSQKVADKHLQPFAQNMEQSASCCSAPAAAPSQAFSPFEVPGASNASCCAKPEPEPVASCCGTAQAQPDSCCAASAPLSESSGLKEKIKHAFRDAWGQFKQVFPYLALGVSLGAFVYGFVPSEFIATYASGDNFFAVPIAAVIGIPLYVRVEALIPLSAVLVEKGMGLGAVMALIIGGGGASLTEVILLKSFFRTPMIIAFLTVILGMAIIAGYLFQYVL